LDAEVATTYERALSRLSKAGATLVDFAFAELLELQSLTLKGGILGSEANAVHRERLALRGDEYDPRVRTRIETGSGINAADYISILKRRAEIIRLYKSYTQGLDAVALPTVMIVPPPISALANDPDYARINGMSLRNTTIGNFLDCCAISIPVNEKGAAPVGLMLMGGWGCDEALFSSAQAVESSLQF
jgi:aspartyl-tRNA(Asn)/glutamyl-tRNA(Gln) amidotransferase subunit A